MNTRIPSPSRQSRTSLTAWCALTAAAAALTAGTAQAAVFATINIDGDTSDWAGIPALVTDPADNGTGVDFNQVFAANDNDYLYLRYTLHTAANPHTFQTDHFYDGDNNTGTGFDVFTAGFLGSEFLIQGAGAFQEAGGGFNEGSLAGGTVIQSPFNVAATDFEWRIDRNVLGVAGAFSGSPLITSDTISFFFTTISGTTDSVGDANTAISYTFAGVPEPGSVAMLGVGALIVQALRRKRRLPLTAAA